MEQENDDIRAMVCYGAIDKNTNRKPQANCMDFFKNKRPLCRSQYN